MDHSTDSFLAAGGVTIFTQTWRPPGAPRARVVLVHGYGEHSGRYTHVAEALTAAGHVVATFDHRGHGRSGGPRGLFTDISQMADDLALFRAQLDPLEDELPQFVLGHSMGGATVLSHLLADPAPLRAAVLSGPYIRNAADIPAPLKLIAPVLGRLLPKLPTQKVPPEGVSRDPQVVADYVADPLVFHSAVPAGTAAALLAIEGQLLTRASSVDVPVLVMHGTDDVLAAHSGSEELVRRVPDATLRSYPGLHHEIFNEPERAEVLADLVAWLDGQLAA